MALTTSHLSATNGNNPTCRFIINLIIPLYKPVKINLQAMHKRKLELVFLCQGLKASSLQVNIILCHSALSLSAKAGS